MSVHYHGPRFIKLQNDSRPFVYRGGEGCAPGVNRSAEIHLYGQEVNPETFAICKADLFMSPRGAVQASSRYSDIWMLSQLPRRSMDAARADRRLPASISRAGISLRARGR